MKISMHLSMISVQLLFARRNKMKKLFILRGVPGCGKSTFAADLWYMLAQGCDGGDEIANSILHVEADHFFMMKDGVYKFDGSKLKEAHAWCVETFKKGIQKNKDIILSNTSTQAWEFEEYKKIAEDAGYQVYCLIVENRHGGKSSHSVPEEKIEQMKKRFEIKL